MNAFDLWDKFVAWFWGPRPVFERFHFVFEWRDLWVGFWIDTEKHRVYFLPIPVVGIYIQLDTDEDRHNKRFVQAINAARDIAVQYSELAQKPGTEVMVTAVSLFEAMAKEEEPFDLAEFKRRLRNEVDIEIGKFIVSE